MHFPFNRVIDAYTHEDEESSKSYASSGDEISEPDTSSLIQEGEDTNTEDEQCGSDSDDASHIQTFDNERFADILDDIHSFIGEDTLTRISPTPDVSHKTCKKTSVVEGATISMDNEPPTATFGRKPLGTIPSAEASGTTSQQATETRVQAQQVTPYDVTDRDLESGPPAASTSLDSRVHVDPHECRATSTIDLEQSIPTPNPLCNRLCHQLSERKTLDKETFVTEQSIELEMADRGDQGTWERWTRRRDTPPERERCRDCDSRLDSLERHRKQNIAQEESNAENMRRLRIRNDELSDELRDVKRRLKELSNARPIIVTQVGPGVDANCGDSRAPVEQERVDRFIYPSITPDPPGFAHVRPRSASFNGRTSDHRSTTNGTRDPPNRGRQPVLTSRANDPESPTPMANASRSYIPATRVDIQKRRDMAPRRDPGPRNTRTTRREAPAQGAYPPVIDSMPRDEPVILMDPIQQQDPAPQREPERRFGRGRGRRNAARNEHSRKETPLQDWLSSAKQHVSTNPVERETAEPIVLKSPSWADEDPDEPDGQFSDHMSDLSSPAHTVSSVMSPLSPNEGDMIAAAESVDIYAVPPSGQVARDQPTTNDPDVAKKRNAAREQPTTDKSTIRKKGQAVREQPTTVPKKGEAVRDQPTTDTSSGAKNQRYKDHGGARPKAPNSLGKGNVKTLNNNAVKSNVNAKRGNGPSNGDKEGPADKRGESYAKVASKNKWKTVGSKKRKYDKVSPKGKRPLKGLAATVNRNVYLQGLDLEGCSDDEEIIDSVREYCRDHGIKPVFIRIIPVRYDSNRAGCKLTVVEEDFERVLDDEFWPDNITVREWTYRPPDNRDNDDGGATDSSDDNA